MRVTAKNSFLSLGLALALAWSSAPAVAAQAASVDGLEHDSRQPSSNGSGLVRFPPAVTREKETRNPTIRRKHPRD